MALPLWLSRIHKELTRGTVVDSASYCAMSDVAKTIIVAEDDDLVRLLTIELLVDEGYVAIPACHAADALELLKAKAPTVHMLFTDLHMPGLMNGLQLAHHVLQHWPWVALLLTSGAYLPQVNDLPAGSRFLLKPYDPNHAVAHAREMIPA